MLAEGLWRIPLPMPFGPPYINVYLIRRPEGWLLVDTGLRTPQSWAALEAGLAAAGVALDAISDIILTHCHPDHTGHAPRLRELTRARFHMHPVDEQLLHDVTSTSLKADELAMVLGWARTPQPLADACLDSYRRLTRLFPNFKADFALADGQTFETSLGPLEVLHTPGHAPGHVCLFLPRQRLLLSADHVIEKITPHIGWMAGHEPLGQFLKTLDRLDQLDVAEILPAHGVPFRGLHAWTSRARSHHAARCASLRAGLNGGRVAVHDMVGAMWPRTLDPLEYQLAVTELMSHLEYMATAGECVRDSDGTWRAL